ncbi:MAG: N-acetylmuramic acid 6-phosphate etherase [Calditrichaceae bacterium]
MPENKVFDDLSALITEGRNPRTTNIDLMSTDEIIQLINDEDRVVAEAVKKELPKISRAVDMIVGAFREQGRLIYVGAGTSGRLGMYDAAECPPTFGVDPEMVTAIIAGGSNALVVSIEGAEDDEMAGREDLRRVLKSNKDVVCGIAASARTPYVRGALDEAGAAGAKKIIIVCNPAEELKIDVDVVIGPVTGPEVIMGSTRMKAGSAQKMILNMLTTASMVKIGKVYENLMVDLKLNSKKLTERAKKLIMIAAAVDYEKASDLLVNSGGSVKTAIFMGKTGCSVSDARNFIDQSDGFLRKAIRDWELSEG